MAKILSVCNRLQAGDYENGNGGKRRVSRLTQFIHATLRLFSTGCCVRACRATRSGYESATSTGKWHWRRRLRVIILYNWKPQTSSVSQSVILASEKAHDGCASCTCHSVCQ